MLEVKDVQVHYGDFVAVDGLTFTIEPGKIFGLLGTNGAGKTTTFRVMMGLLDPTRGEVLFEGEKIGYHNVDDIGYMIEERSLLTKMTVKELMLYFGQLKSMKKPDILKALDHWLHVFEVPEYKDKKIKELSKGNQQKIQFITALIHDPKLLILDEPFSGLDPINTDLFVKVVREQQAKGKMIVFSSHQLDHVESFCESIAVLERGRSIVQGDIKKVKDDFQKMTIQIIADIDPKVFEDFEGVYDVQKNGEGFQVKIVSKDYIQPVFELVKEAPSVTKFDVEQASLSEIFLAKVGASRGQA